MKSKKLTRLIALMLTLILALVPSATALAGSTEKSNVCPTVFVHGFMDSDIYKNCDKNDEEVGAVTSEDILAMIAKCVPALTSFLVTKDWDKLGQTVTPIAYNTFAKMTLDENGNPRDNSGVDFEYPAPETVKKDSVLKFKYDWRVDPLESAAELDKFIDYVRECSGCDKVALTGFSFGGVIVITYLSVYGMDKIQGVLYNSTAIYGESYTGDLLTGKIELSSDSVNEYLKYFLDQTEYENLVNGIIDILTAAGIYDLLLPICDDILLYLSDYLIPGVFAPIFAGWLSIWAMVPDEYIDDAMKYIFDDVYGGTDEHAGLVEKIESYNSTVRAHKTETLIKSEKECRIGVLSGYGYSSILATPSWDNISDGVIDTKYTSFGATVSKYGQTLSDEHIAAVDEKYISPDETVDASTCLFPEKTWFIKYLKHSHDYKNVEQLINAIFFADEEITVDTFEEYPRYLINDVENEVVRSESKDENSYLYSQSTFVKIFVYIIKFVRSILDAVLK